MAESLSPSNSILIIRYFCNRRFLSMPSSLLVSFYHCYGKNFNEDFNKFDLPNRI